jgi:hypothetical protein
MISKLNECLIIAMDKTFALKPLHAISCPIFTKLIKTLSKGYTIIQKDAISPFYWFFNSSPLTSFIKLYKKQAYIYGDNWLSSQSER